MNKGITAARLRVILILVIVLMTAAVAGGFWFAQQKLMSYATEISKLNADAQSGDSSIQTLKNLEIDLNNRQKVIEDARALVADNATYADKAVEDISKIAKETGISITGFEFTSAGSSTTPASPAAPAPTTGATTPEAPPSTGGVSKKTISVAIESPINYDNLMQFIERIETNPLKLEFASISMTKGEGNLVETPNFTIGVYVR